jgi:iron-sulfur cluster assembly accessory protein
MDAQTFIVTDRAARRIAEILGAEAPSSLLRVSVEGGGCSGFQYKFDIQHEAAADDFVIEQGGVKIVVDPVSLQYMAGSALDYVDDLIGASFKVNNPKAKASCASLRSICRTAIRRMKPANTNSNLPGWIGSPPARALCSHLRSRSFSPAITTSFQRRKTCSMPNYGKPTRFSCRGRGRDSARSNISA